MNLANNKKNAIAFYKTAYEGNPQKAVADYVGDDYIQPAVANGKSGFIEYFERMQAQYPNKSIEFVRCIAEDDLVSLHTHQVWHNEDKTIDEFVTMDFFRFDDSGKIVEHWDSIQQIPKDSANDQTMY